MSRLDVMFEAKNSAIVKFVEFTRISKRGKVALFFEGEDEKYYSVRVCAAIPGLNWGAVVCGGKSAVLKVRDIIRENSEYKDDVCAFFVDADFDDNSALSGLPDVFVTPCYSVENLYCSEAAFKRILSAEFSIAEHGEEESCFVNAVSVYGLVKDQFLEAVSDFNYWIRSYRVLERENKVSGRLNINNISFDDLVSVSVGSCSRSYVVGQEVDLFPEASREVPVDKTMSQAHFEDLDKVLWFRGKQNLEFLRVYLGRVKEDRCSREGRKIFKERGNVKLNLTKANVLSELSNYADTPTSLSVFFRNLQRQLREKGLESPESSAA